MDIVKLKLLMDRRDSEKIKSFVVNNQHFKYSYWVGVSAIDGMTDCNLLESRYFKFVNDASNHHNSHILSLGTFENKIKFIFNKRIKSSNLHCVLLSERELDNQWMMGSSPKREYRSSFQRGLKGLTYSSGGRRLTRSGSLCWQRYSRQRRGVQYMLLDRHKPSLHVVACPCKRKSNHSCRSYSCGFQSFKLK